MKALLRLLLAASLIVPRAMAQQNLPDLGDVSQADFTPLQERRLGESIMREIRADSSFYDDAEATDYVNALGYRLVSNSQDARQEFEFFLIRDPTVNAFALPGGFVGAHTGLILTAQSESELASVMAHEISHVTQRHIARMIAQQKQTQLMSLAALAIAILAARSNSQVTQAAIMGSQAATMQSALNFTRDHEREADRVGIQILDAAGFDAQGMPAFFERLQRATRIYETSAPAYLRTHPLTYERMADMQNRAENMRYRQVPDSIEFQLVRAKIRALTDNARDAVTFFEDNLTERKFTSETAARYGLAAALFANKNTGRARQEIDTLRKLGPRHPMIETLAGRIYRANGELAGALKLYAAANKSYPNNRAVIYEYADTLIEGGGAQTALRLLDERVRVTPSDYHLYLLQARAYAALNRRLLSHQAQAEAYARVGNLHAAIEQLQIALKAGDGEFHQLSAAEARLRELRRSDEEARREQQKR